MIGNEWRSTDMKTTVERSLVIVAALLMCAGALPASELHPIVEVQSGYLFGATKDGKWVKADEAAKALPDQTTYLVYGLTESLGEAKGGKAKSEAGPCEGTFVVGLSDKPEKGAIALAAPWSTGCSCRIGSPIGLKVAASHKRAVRSLLAVAIRAPSGLNAASTISSSCRMRGNNQNCC